MSIKNTKKLIENVEYKYYQVRKTNNEKVLLPGSVRSLICQSGRR